MHVDKSRLKLRFHRKNNFSDDHANKSSIELNSPGPEEPQLNFETNLETYTRGIDVQQVNISGEYILNLHFKFKFNQNVLNAGTF